VLSVKKSDSSGTQLAKKSEDAAAIMRAKQAAGGSREEAHVAL